MKKLINYRFLLTSTLLSLFFLGGAALGPVIFAADSSVGKKMGFTGDPAKKRGLEYGFDKGFSAGKSDLDAGLKPDPKRHEDYTNPDKFYRYEFGSRAAFTSGFKSGFNGGYQKAFGKKVKIIDMVSGSPTKKDPMQEDVPKPASKAPSAVNDAM